MPSSLGQPIAVGRTAEVYGWEERSVLKLFRPPWSTPASVEHEARIARAVHTAGLPVPGVGDVDGEQLCHGDFHPGNVMMTSGGPVIVDWVDATRGAPLGDIARTCLLLQIGVPGRSAVQRWWAATVLGEFRRTYLTRSLERCPAGTAGVAAWEPLCAAARLSEHVADEREWLLRIVEGTFLDRSGRPR